MSSDSEDDGLPISQMVARRRSRRNAPPPPPPKKKKQLPKERPANARRSRRLQSSSPPPSTPEKVPAAKQKAVKKRATQGKPKAVAQSKKKDDMFSPRKTRAQRRTAAAIEETTQDESNKEKVVKEKKKRAKKDEPKRKRAKNDSRDASDESSPEEQDVSVQPDPAKKDDEDATDVDEEKQKTSASNSKQPQVNSDDKNDSNDASHNSSPGEDETGDVSVKPDPAKKEDNDAMNVDEEEQKEQPQVDSASKEDASNTSKIPIPDDEDASVQPDPKKEDNDDMNAEEEERETSHSVSKQHQVDSDDKEDSNETSNKSSPDNEDASVQPDPKKGDNEGMNAEEEEQKEQPQVDSGAKEDASNTSNKSSPKDPKKDDNDVMDVKEDEKKASMSKQPRVNSGAPEDVQSKKGGASVDSNDQQQDSSKVDLPDKIEATAPKLTEKEVLEDDSKVKESEGTDRQTMSSGSEDMIVDDDQGKQNDSKDATDTTAVEMVDVKQGDSDKTGIDKSTLPSEKHIVDDSVTATAPTPTAEINDDVTMPIKGTTATTSQEPPIDITATETRIETLTEVDESATREVKESAPAPVAYSVAEKGQEAVEEKAISKVNEDAVPSAQEFKQHGDEIHAGSQARDPTTGDEQPMRENDELAKGDGKQKVIAPPTPTPEVVETTSKGVDFIVKSVDTKNAVPVKNTGPSEHDQATKGTVEATSPLDLLANAAKSHDTPMTDKPSKIVEATANPLDLLAAAIADKGGDITDVVADKPSVTNDSDTVATDDVPPAKSGSSQAPVKITDVPTGVESIDKPTSLKDSTSIEVTKKEAKATKDVPVESAPAKLGAPVAESLTPDSSVAARRTTEGSAATANSCEEKDLGKADTAMGALDSSTVVAVKDQEPRCVPAEGLSGPQAEGKEQTEKEKSCPPKGPSSPSIKASVQENIETTVAVEKAVEVGAEAKPHIPEHHPLSFDSTASNTPKTDLPMANMGTSHGTASTDQQGVVAIGDVASTIDAVLVGTTGFASPPDTKMPKAQGGGAMHGLGVEAEDADILAKPAKGPPRSSMRAKPVIVTEKTPVAPVVDTLGANDPEENSPVNESQNESQSESQSKSDEATTSILPDAPMPTKRTETDVFEAKTATEGPLKLDNSIESSSLDKDGAEAVPMEVDAIKPNPSEPCQSVEQQDKSTVEVDSFSKMEKEDVAEEVFHRVSKKAKTSTTTGDRTVSVVYQPPTPEETAELLITFPGLKKHTTFSNSRSKKRGRKQLSICIPGISGRGNSEASKSTLSVGRDKSLQGTKETPSPSDLPLSREGRFDAETTDVSSRYEQDFEDSLDFFSETHEEQDPGFIESQRNKVDSRLKQELADIKKEYEAGVRKINEVIMSQINEKRANVEKNLPQLVSNQTQDEQRDLRRLKEAYVQKLKAHTSKVNDNIQRMTAHHSKEMQKAQLQHRQQAQQRGIPEQVVSAEWGPLAQRLQAKQQQQLKDYNTSGENLKKAIEAEYQREKDKYIAFYEKKRKDLQEKVQKAVARIRTQFQLQQQRYVKALTLKLKTRREELRSLLAEPNQDNREPSTVTKDNESVDNIELQSPSPVKISVPPHAIDFDEGNDSPSASSRSRHRKAVLHTLHKQLSVEIHNEGLWISALPEKGEDSNKAKHPENGDKTKSEFVPWGNKARTVLYSIVCGEIPSGYGADRFDFGNAVASQGGHIKCVVVDLRTSAETASAQRAVAMKKQEADCVKILEEKVEKLSRTVAEAELHGNKAAAEEKQVLAYHEKATKEVEKANDMIKQLRSKFKNLLGPDDLPLPKLNSSDTQKLTNAMKKCNSHLESAQSRLKVAETALQEKRSRTQKMATLVKQATKASAAAATSLKKKRAQMNENKSSRSKGRLSETMEMDRASTRVADTIGALQMVAEMRREQLNQKRSSASSGAYAHSLPDLPNALKTSLWHKMHRRRQQIVLRPTMEHVLGDLKETVEASVVYGKDRASRNIPTTEDAAVRAEQLFLLAAFPEQGLEPLSSTPPSNSHTAWGEPGWKLNLEVPKKGRGSHSLLPCMSVSSIMQQNHSEMSSAPGRQAASLMKGTHLQSLCTPLSATGQAVSLAETTPISKDVKLSENDPFNVKQDALTTGYTFALRASRTSPSKSPSHSRKKQPPKVQEPIPPPPAAIPTPPKPRPKPSVLKPKPGPVAPESPAQVPMPSPPKRTSSTGSRRPSAVPEKPPESKPKRSRSKSSSGVSPRKKSKQSVEAAAAADVASQARNFMQQAAASALYGQQQRAASAVATMDQTAQYSPNYMKQMAQNQVNLQALQPPQLQQAMTAQQQQQLLPQPPYGSPQQFQQRQLAQMRLMQQQQVQQQASRTNFSQQQANMQFFNPAAMQAAAAAQQQFGVQQAPPMPPIPPPPGPQRRAASGEEQNRNDPLFMLRDVPPPPPPPPPPPQP